MGPSKTWLVLSQGGKELGLELVEASLSCPWFPRGCWLSRPWVLKGISPWSYLGQTGM